MLEIVIDQRRRDLGGFEVGPGVAQRRSDGWSGRSSSSIIWGRLTFPAGIPRSVDVRPHPHIGLSTVTYLFEGEIMHRDSVGSEQPIRPGEVNWMTAGRGITHSERFERRGAKADDMHGIAGMGGIAGGERGGRAQLCALRRRGACLSLRIMDVRSGSSRAGCSASEAQVKTHSPMFYAHVELPRCHDRTAAGIFRACSLRVSGRSAHGDERFQAADRCWCSAGRRCFQV